MSRLSALLELHQADPNDADLLFMIASEHVAAGEHAEAVPWLERYVAAGSDVGAGWALLADCHEVAGKTELAVKALESGIPAAMACGHPTMAGEMRGRIEELAGEG